MWLFEKLRKFGRIYSKPADNSTVNEEIFLFFSADLPIFYEFPIFLPKRIKFCFDIICSELLADIFPAEIFSNFADFLPVYLRVKNETN